MKKSVGIGGKTNLSEPALHNSKIKTMKFWFWNANPDVSTDMQAIAQIPVDQKQKMNSKKNNNINNPQ